ncbi:RND family efflux transporter MFP subunit [Rhodobium orientis]|nr:efflux RND transporter periplasmic adaptor subunit [Rhodobium orientis]MBB4304895.1 RND family efflux transporter MFP subunit [Rhodobium orientis]
MRHARLLVVLALPLLAACEEKAEAPPPPVRAIKSMVVSDRVGEQQRKIAGVVEAATVTDLSFEIGGRLTELPVDIGQAVATGDTVARIDPTPLELALKSAVGELTEAQSKLTDAKAKFEQQDALFAKGYTTKSAYDTAQANLSSAEAVVDRLKAQRDKAERNLKNATLTAPFDGRISEKYVDRFTEVQSGQKIVQLSAGGEREVQANVPAGIIGRIATGDTVSVAFPTLPGRTVAGTITQIGSRAGQSNAFPVIAALAEDDPDIRAGMTAEVTFSFKTADTGEAFLVPLPAVVARGDKRKGVVYVFDKEAGVVRERQIQIVNIRDNFIVVAGGLEKGDVIAVAGTSFLHDGMEVKLLDNAGTE